jgi:tetratricopeptide (TPR) repeat protein
MEDEEAAKTAEQEIGRMNGTRELKEKIREALKDARAGLVLEQAAGFEQTGDYESALRLYDAVSEQYKETKSGNAAIDAIARIRDDQAAQKAIAARRELRLADRLLDLGERYRRLELYDQAREQFELLIKDHADSEAAKQAREELKTLPASTAKAD